MKSRDKWFISWEPQVYSHVYSRVVTVMRFYTYLLTGLVVLQRRTHVRMWLPGKAAWRSLQGGAAFQPTGNGTHSVPAAISDVIMLVRPGRVVPVHKEVRTLLYMA